MRTNTSDFPWQVLLDLCLSIKNKNIAPVHEQAMWTIMHLAYVVVVSQMYV